jgi:hypothetical protein
MMMKCNFLIKKSLVFIFVCFSISGFSQVDINKLKKLKQKQQILNFIYEVSDAHSDVQLAAIRWCHWNADVNNQKDFQYLASDRFAVLQEKFNAMKSTLDEDSVRIHQIESLLKVDKITTACKQLMTKLHSAEVYDNSKVHEAMVVHLRRNILTPGKVLRDDAHAFEKAYETQITDALSKMSFNGKITAMIGGKKINLDHAVDDVIDITDLSRTNALVNEWELLASLWIYEGNADDVMNSLKVSFPAIHNSTDELKQDLLANKQYKLVALLEQLDLAISDVTESLDAPNKYDDATIKLLMEDKLESEIAPLCKELHAISFKGLRQAQGKFLSEIQ